MNLAAANGILFAPPFWLVRSSLQRCPAGQETDLVGTAVPPFGIMDSSGQLTAYGVDVMKAIAADAGFDVEFGELIPALLAGAIEDQASSTSSKQDPESPELLRDGTKASAKGPA